MTQEAPTARSHDRKPATDEEDDYTRRIKQTGCSELNEQVLDCYFREKDWTKCQTQVQAFRDCFQKHSQQRKPQ